jgi:hypothetical protein
MKTDESDDTEWFLVKSPDQDGVLLDSSKGLIGQDLIDQYFSSFKKRDTLVAISSDGTRAKIVTADNWDYKEIDLNPPIDMSSFKLPEIKSVLTSVIVGGLEGEVILEKTDPVLHIGSKQYGVKSY